MKGQKYVHTLTVTGAEITVGKVAETRTGKTTSQIQH